MEIKYSDGITDYTDIVSKTKFGYCIIRRMKMATKKPERVGATIERSAAKRAVSRIKKSYTSSPAAQQALDEVLDFLSGRITRVKKPGGL